MSENNYAAQMLKSAVATNDDINLILSPGIYPIPPGNSSSPDSLGGVLTVYASSPVRRTFSSDKIIFASSTYSNGAWTPWISPSTIGSPPIGIPFFCASAAMPNTIIPEWSDMVFLKWNGATFSAAEYPKLALMIPSLKLTEARGEFPRIWDDGRGVDSGRALLSAQSSAAPEISASFDSSVRRSSDNALLGTIGNPAGSLAGVGQALPVVIITNTDGTLLRYVSADFKASRSSSVYQSVSEVRSRNIAFNFLVRAK